MTDKFQIQAFKVELSEISNATTGLPLAGVQKKLGTKIESSSLFSNGFQVLLPKGSCVKGHLVSLAMEIDFGQGSTEMLATGVIGAVDPHGEKILVTVEFKERNSKLWKSLLDSIESQQDRVTHILESIKGSRDV